MAGNRDKYGFAIIMRVAAATVNLPAQAVTLVNQLGKSIFFDKNLSINKNQACASCHGPAVGWTGPDESINGAGAVYEGSIPGKFGDRKPPSSAYATFSPILHLERQNNGWPFSGGSHEIGSGVCPDGLQHHRLRGIA